MLTPEELEQLSGGETLFRSPIPVQFVSSDEYMPSPQSAQQKEFEARIKEMGAQLAKKHGMTRRRFFKTAGGNSLHRGNVIERAWRDAHAGSVHVANDIEHALSMWGRGIFGLKVEDNLV